MSAPAARRALGAPSGACRVCGVSTALTVLRQHGGHCEDHKDETWDADGLGCPECGQINRHVYDCPAVT